VALRIEALVRPHDTVVRWGGDEFLILLEQVPDEGVALEIAERITAAVAQPLQHRGRNVTVTASVGIAFARPADRLGTDELVRQADAAMYEVKHNGRNAFGVFTPNGEAPTREPEEPLHHLVDASG